MINKQEILACAHCGLSGDIRIERVTIFTWNNVEIDIVCLQCDRSTSLRTFEHNGNVVMNTLPIM